MNKHPTRHTPRWSLLVIPVVIFFSGLAFMKSMFPIYINSGVGYGPDAAYVYLFAALDMLQGYSPAFTDHPGTPLQSIIAIIIPVVWFVTSAIQITTAGMIDSVVQNPELYLFTVSILLSLLTAGATHYLGLKLYRETSNIGLATSCQLAPLLFSVVSPMMAYPTAESFMQSISIFLIATLIPLFYRDSNKSDIKFRTTALVAGALCGVGVATKLTFLPMLSLVLILRSYRLILLSIAGFATAWIISVLPIVSKLPEMLEWYLNMGTHSDLHGLGSTTIFDPSRFAENINYLYHFFPFFYQVLVAVFIIFIITGWLVIKSKGKLPDNFPFGSAVLITLMSAQTVAVAKHPGISYMVPVLPAAVFAASWVLTSAIRLIDHSVSKKLENVGSLICMGVIASIAIVNTLQAYESVAALRARAEHSHNNIENEIAKYENPILIGTFNCSFKECATWFGIALTHGLDLRMNEVNPQFYYFDIFAKNLRIPGSPELPREATPKTVNDLINAGRTILLISPSYDNTNQFKLTELVKTPNQNLYRVNGYE